MARMRLFLFHSGSFVVDKTNIAINELARMLAYDIAL